MFRSILDVGIRTWICLGCMQAATARCSGVRGGGQKVLGLRRVGSKGKGVDGKGLCSELKWMYSSTVISKLQMRSDVLGTVLMDSVA